MRKHIETAAHIKAIQEIDKLSDFKYRIRIKELVQIYEADILCEKQLIACFLTPYAVSLSLQ